LASVHTRVDVRGCCRSCPGTFLSISTYCLFLFRSGTVGSQLANASRSCARTLANPTARAGRRLSIILFADASEYQSRRYVVGIARPPSSSVRKRWEGWTWPSRVNRPSSGRTSRISFACDAGQALALKAMDRLYGLSTILRTGNSASAVAAMRMVPFTAAISLTSGRPSSTCRARIKGRAGS
jgi:hypothetical protein